MDPSTGSIEIRSACVADARRIAEIYNHYVAASTATFDTVPKSEADREAWLSGRDTLHPVLVAARDDEVVGWVSLSAFRERPAWRFTAEIGVYVENEARGQGIGSLLVEHALQAAEDLGLRAIVALVVAENDASVRLFERSGFDRVGVMREVGYKFGEWLDLVVLEMLLPVPEGVS